MGDLLVKTCHGAHKGSKLNLNGMNFNKVATFFILRGIQPQQPTKK
jgi:hypothetical protein